MKATRQALPSTSLSTSRGYRSQNPSAAWIPCARFSATLPWSPRPGGSSGMLVEREPGERMGGPRQGHLTQCRKVLSASSSTRKCLGETGDGEGTREGFHM